MQNIKRFTISGGAVGALLATVLVAGPAAAALTPADQDCRATRTKNIAKAFKAAGKIYGKCHKLRNKGKVDSGVDCNDISTLSVKDQAKLQKSVDKMTATVATCVEADSSLVASFDLQVSCPSPCDDNGINNPMVDLDDVAECLECLVKEGTGAAYAETFGLPADPGTLTKAASKCHSTMVKGYGKFIDAALKDKMSCQGDADEAASADGDPTTCDEAPLAKATKALTKAGAGATGKCTDADLADLGMCDTMSTAGLKTCADTNIVAQASKLFTNTYANPASMCPNFLTTLIRPMVDGTISGICDPSTFTCSGGANDGAACTASCSETFSTPCDENSDCPGGEFCDAARSSDCYGTTDTALSIGWKGLAHEVDIPGNYFASVGLSCPGTPDEPGSLAGCGDCTITGIADTFRNDTYTNFTRCNAAPWIVCDNPMGSDPVNCAGFGDDSCNYLLGGNLHSVSGGSPTCATNVAASDFTGTANPLTGEGSLILDLRAKVHIGGPLNQPCPVCGDQFCSVSTTTACTDETVEDVCPGEECVRRCIDGPRDGQVCEIHATEETWGATSHDCPPSLGSNISGSGLVIPLPLSTGTTTKTAAVTCDVATTRKCHTAQCTIETDIGCYDNSDCTAPGDLCGSKSVGAELTPNDCSPGSDYECVASISNPSTFTGECAELALFSFCDGFLRADGTGFLPCDPSKTDGFGFNPDCDAISEAGVCGAGGDGSKECGTCSNLRLKSCFLPTAEVEGVPDPERPVLAGMFPLPPTGNAAIDFSVGTPGLGVVEIETEATFSYR